MSNPLKADYKVTIITISYYGIYMYFFRIKIA